MKQKISFDASTPTQLLNPLLSQLPNPLVTITMPITDTHGPIPITKSFPPTAKCRMRAFYKVRYCIVYTLARIPFLQLVLVNFLSLL